VTLAGNGDGRAGRKGPDGAGQVSVGGDGLVRDSGDPVTVAQVGVYTFGCGSGGPPPPVAPVAVMVVTAAVLAGIISTRTAGPATATSNAKTNTVRTNAVPPVSNSTCRRRRRPSPGG